MFGISLEHKLIFFKNVELGFSTENNVVQLKYNEIDSFLKRSVTGDEKWVIYTIDS